MGVRIGIRATIFFAGSELNCVVGRPRGVGQCRERVISEVCLARMRSFQGVSGVEGELPRDVEGETIALKGGRAPRFEESLGKC
jgi:hypothetical protein